MGSEIREHAPRFEPGTVVDGRYRVVGFVAEGGSSVVHEVEHVLTGRRLALKSLLDEGAHGRLEQEARAASMMKNPRAVKVTDMGVSPTIGPYLVMELLEGQSLRAMLEDAGQLPLELTVNIALQVCECLAEAHAQGLVHRDLKPDNIHLAPGASPGEWDVKVLDFGVVKVGREGPIPTSSLTRTGSTVGTPFYMSLEQLRNSSNVDGRADVYALSVVLYECLAGTRPFQADTLGDLVYMICSGPPTAIGRLRPDLPAPVTDTIMRGLGMQRERRPAGMIELATELAPFGDPALSAWLTAAPRANRQAPPRLVPATSEAARTVALPTPPSGARPAALGGPPPAAAPEVPTFVRASDAALPGDDDAARPVEAAPGEPAPVPDLVVERAPRAVSAVQDEPEPEPELELDATLRRVRDTPTELYAKAGDGDAIAIDVAPAPVAPAPFPRAVTASPPTAPIPGRATLRIDPGLYATLRTPGELSPNVSPTPPPFVARAPHDEPPTGPPASVGPRSVPPVSGPPPSMPPRSLAAPSASPPAWQSSLDSALHSVGDAIERAVDPLVDAFREAPRRQQIALVMVAAGILGVFLVLLFFLILAHSP
jgi:serine/threonine-protein kinase